MRDAQLNELLELRTGKKMSLLTLIVMAPIMAIDGRLTRDNVEIRELLELRNTKKLSVSCVSNHHQNVTFDSHGQCFN